MSETQKKKPVIQIDQAKKFLVTFYQKPVAQVSTELFFTIGATIFFAIFAIRPTIITMTELVKEIEDKREASEALKRKVAALSSVQNEYFSLQDQFYLLEETIPTDIHFQTILQSVEKTASDLQLSILSLQLQEVPLPEAETLVFTKKTPVVANITVTITGSYQQIRDFIDKTSQLRPLLSVDSVAVSSGGGDSEQDFLTATVRIQSHFYSKTKPKTNEDAKSAESAEDAGI